MAVGLCGSQQVDGGGVGTGGVLDMLATLDLGTVIIGDQVDATVPYTNQGTEPLQIFDVNATPATRFANCAPLTTLPVNVAPGGSGDVIVRCDVVAPVGAGGFDVLTATSDPNTASFTTSVTATVEAPAPEIAISRGGNDIPDGTNDAFPLGGAPGAVVLDTWTVTNSGTGPLTVTEPTFDNELGCTAVLFSPLGTTSIAPNASASFTLAITPSGVGSHAWAFDLELLNDDANEATFDITVSGGVFDPPVLSTPASVAMGDVPTGQVSTASITVVNLGGDPGTISSIVVDTPTNGAATLNPAPNLPLTIAGGASTTINVDVTPAADGAVSTNVVIDSDDPNAPQITVPVTANGVSPEIDIQRTGSSIASGGTDAQGTVTAGSQQTLVYTVTNTGAATLTLGSPTFSSPSNVSGLLLTSAPATQVAPGGSTTFTVVYTGTTDGSFSFDIQLANDDADESVYTVSVSGTADGDPEIDLQYAGQSVPIAGTVTLPATDTGSAVSVVINIQNTGTAPLQLTGLNSPGATNATVSLTSGIPTALAPGAITSVTVDITPTTQNGSDFSVDLNVLSDDANEGVYGISITGPVNAPELDLDVAGVPTPDFGTTPLASTVQTYVTSTVTIGLTNNGELPLTITSASAGNTTNCTASVAVGPPATIAPGTLATFDVQFSPTFQGSFSFEVAVYSNDQDENPYVVTIEGVGVEPSIFIGDASGQLISKGSTHALAAPLPIGVAHATTFTISNVNGSEELTVLSLTFPSQTDCAVSAQSVPATVAAGQSSIVPVTITPSAPGFSFALTVTSNDPDDSPYTITVTDGGDPQMDVIYQGNPLANVTTVDVGGLVVGSGGIIEFDIESSGAIALTVSSTGIGVTPTNATASIATDPTGVIPSGGTGQLDVQINPQAVGSFSVLVSITSDDPNNPLFTINLVGTALSAFSCQGLPEFPESEPNDSAGTAGQLLNMSGSFCVTGQTECGNFFTPDADLFDLSFATSGPRTFTLMWDVTADVDQIVFDPQTGPVISFQESDQSPETASATFTAGTMYFLEISCFVPPTNVFPNWILLVEE